MSLYDYQSPIEMIATEMRTQYENDCVSICQSYGFKVDKDELAKALAYDRNQYDKGFKDGYNQALLERPAYKWIPVSERLPEHTGWYVVTREGMCRRLISIVAFDAKYKNWERGGIVAWIDVKPYEGSEEE